jgi:phage gpG-like protein
MSVRIVDVDTSALRKRFAIMTRRSKDFRPVFRWVMQELQKAHRTNFATQGASSGFPWSPLDPQYSSWKTENYGAKGILVRDGTLKHSLTVDSGRGAVRDMGLRTAEFGTQLPYAKFHQTGTPNMAQRKPVFVPPLMAFQTATVVGEHIMYGSIGVRYADAMKGFVI